MPKPPAPKVADIDDVKAAGRMAFRVVVEIPIDHVSFNVVHTLAKEHQDA